MATRRRRTARAALRCALLALCAAPAVADEPGIIKNLTAFIQTDDRAQRKSLAAAIEQDPAYDRAKLSAWLHAADLWKPLAAGRTEITVPIRGGPASGGVMSRVVTLRIPTNYDPRKPWPLLYVLHGSGGNGPGILDLYEKLLGAAVDNYVLAAPTDYADLIVHQQEWPPTGEHPTMLRKIKQTVHVDSDRVFVTGYSLGGHTTWTLAVLYTDQWAGAMPLASTFTLFLPDYFWEVLLPNLRPLPLLAVWGSEDKFYGGERISPEGGITGVNRELRKLVDKLGLPAVMIELPGVGHGGVVPPADELARLLAQRRAHWPKAIKHVFRHPVQGPAWWLEPHVWAGDMWTDKHKTLSFGPGESSLSNEDFDRKVAQTYRGLLGEVSGEASGQELKIYRKRIREVTVWLGDGLIDWSAPVTLDTGEKTKWTGPVSPDLFVCLTQAARTWDFDRLRWAGLRVRSGEKVQLVDANTKFPEPFDDPNTAKKPENPGKTTPPAKR